MNKKQAQAMPGPSVSCLAIGEMLNHMPLRYGPRSKHNVWITLRGKVVRSLDFDREKLVVKVVYDDETTDNFGPGDWDEVGLQGPTDLQIEIQRGCWVEKRLRKLEEERDAQA